MTHVLKVRLVPWSLGGGRSLPFPLQDLQPSAARLLSALLPVYAAVGFTVGSGAAALPGDTAGSWVAQLSEIVMGKKGRSLSLRPCHCGCPYHACWVFFCRVPALCGCEQC